MLEEPNGINLAKIAIQYADGIIMGTDTLHPELESYIKKDLKLPVLPYIKISADNTKYIQEYNIFYDKFLETHDKKK